MHFSFDPSFGIFSLRETSRERQSTKIRRINETLIDPSVCDQVRLGEDVTFEREICFRDTHDAPKFLRENSTRNYSGEFYRAKHKRPANRAASNQLATINIINVVCPAALLELSLRLRESKLLFLKFSLCPSNRSLKSTLNLERRHRVL